MGTVTAQCKYRPATAGAPRRRPVLGIDPGLQRTGYALLSACGRDAVSVVEAGVIRLDPRQPLESRLVELENSLAELISTYQPAVLACEQLYAHYKHPRTAIIMAHARGVILALAARRGLEIVHVAATHVKKHLTGSGRAGKAQIQRAVAATLNLPQIPEPNDVADALAVALCGLRMQHEAKQSSAGPPRPTKGSVGSPCPTKGSVGSPCPTKGSVGPPRPTNRTAPPTPTGAHA